MYIRCLDFLLSSVFFHSALPLFKTCSYTRSCSSAKCRSILKQAMWGGKNVLLGNTFYYTAWLNTQLWLVNHSILRSVISEKQTVAMDNRPLLGTLCGFILLYQSAEISPLCVCLSSVHCSLWKGEATGWRWRVFRALINVTVSGTSASLGVYSLRTEPVDDCWE